jgi:hypothetical protein
MINEQVSWSMSETAAFALTCRLSHALNRSSQSSGPKARICLRRSVDITLGVCDDDVGSHFACQTDDLESDCHIWSVALDQSADTQEGIGSTVSQVEYRSFTRSQHYSIS